MADILKGRKVFEEGGKMKKMKKKGAPQLAMSRDTRNEDQKYLGVKSDSRAITKKEKDRRDSYRRGRYIKKPLSIMEKGGKVTARKAKRTERQAGKEDRFAARNRMQPDPRTKEQKAEAYRKRRNKRLTRAMMGAITGAVVGGGEYNVRQRKS